MKIKNVLASMFAAVSIFSSSSVSAQGFEPDYVATIKQKCDKIDDTYHSDTIIGQENTFFHDCTRRAYNIPINISQDFNKLLRLYFAKELGVRPYSDPIPWDFDNADHLRAMTFNDVCDVVTTFSEPERTQEDLQTLFNQPIFCLAEILELNAQYDIGFDTTAIPELKAYLESLPLELLIET